MPFQTSSVPELLLNLRRFQCHPLLCTITSFIFLASLPQPVAPCSTWGYCLGVHTNLSSAAEPSHSWPVHGLCPQTQGLLFSMRSKAMAHHSGNPLSCPCWPGSNITSRKVMVPLTSASKRCMGLWDRLPLDTCINLTRSQVSRRLGPYSLTSICVPRYAQHRRNLSVHESASNPRDLHRKCQMCHCGKQQLTKLTCWVYKNTAIFCLSTQDNSLKWAIEKELFYRHSEN